MDKRTRCLVGKRGYAVRTQWKYKLGSRERGNCLDRIAESQNQLQEPFFNVSQKSIRDRLMILERDFKRKDRFERNASGILP